MLTQQRLRAVLRYDPTTGQFTWARGLRAGRIAGTIHDSRGSLKVSIDGKRYPLHRLAWFWMTGLMPRWNIEHIDGVRSNNRWANLREGDRAQKRDHRTPYAEPTGRRGVVRIGDHFEALIVAEDGVLNLGRFSTAKAAESAISGRLRTVVSDSL
ncbi:HNH endonuclease [Pararhodobacter oceanensis]|nr:HNH endonuclease [Pararhodobacter oceanensis]